MFLTPLLTGGAAAVDEASEEEKDPAEEVT
jgi:hypothetical protein